MNVDQKLALTPEQLSVLRHTARNRRFCGAQSEVLHLVELGLMKSFGYASWCPDEFFGFTDAGREALRRYNA